MTRKPPYESIDADFLEPRDPVLGYIKIGGKDPKVRMSRAGKPWVGPVRYVNPARFEVTTREKKVEIHKGTGKEAQNKFPVDMGFIRDKAFHDRIQEENPTALRIRLMYPTAAENIIYFLGAHSGSEWVCRGNGVEAQDVKRGACVCPCPRLAQFEGTYEGTRPKDKTACKPRGTFMPILEDAEIFGGFWPFKTTSWESISNIVKTLTMLESMFERVDGLPLEMRVQAATKSYGEGQTTQPIVTVVLAAAMETARQIASDAAKESQKFLPAGSDQDIQAYRDAALEEMETEGEDYASEFDPDSVDPDGPVQAAAVEDDAEAEDDSPPYEVVDDDDDGDPDPEEEEGEDGADVDAEAEADAALEETLREVLKEAGWDPQTINDRIEYHRRKDGHMRRAAELVQTNMADAWEVVTGETAEPADDLAEGGE